MYHLKRKEVSVKSFHLCLKVGDKTLMQDELIYFSIQVEDKVEEGLKDQRHSTSKSFWKVSNITSLLFSRSRKKANYELCDNHEKSIREQNLLLQEIDKCNEVSFHTSHVMTCSDTIKKWNRANPR